MEGKEYKTVRRRQLLAALGSVGTVGLAGCGSTSDSEVGEVSDKNVQPPVVDSTDRWELTTPDSEPRLIREGSVGPLDYTAHSHVVRYEDTELRQRISEATFGEIDRPFAVAFAARVEIFPSSISGAAGLQGEEIDSAITDNLRSAMQNFGVQNTEIQGTMDGSTTPAGEFRVVRGEYPIEEVTIEDIDIPHSSREELSFGGENLPIKGIAGRWQSNDSILAGGGVYPDAEFEDTEEVSMSDAVSLNMTIDLNLRPTQRENQILNFVDGISP